MTGIKTLWVVEVEYNDQDDVPTSDFHGPWESQRKAQVFADRVNANLEKLPADPNGQRTVRAYVHRLRSKHIRPIVAEARAFLKGED